jgi:hypothetical protein
MCHPTRVGETRLFTAERYQEVSSELQRILAYLQALAQEIEASLPPDNRGFTWVAVLDAESAIGHLQHLLAQTHPRKAPKMR